MGSLFALLFLGQISHAFLLIDPDYRLANPESTRVNLASGACRAAGMSDAELNGALGAAIEDYWDTVAESRLRLRLGGEVSRPITSQPQGGEILVGCMNNGAGSPSAVAYPDFATRSARIVINSDVFTPGGYYPDGLVGVLAHEMGHALGLHHSADPASVMTYESHLWGAKPTYLSQDDKDGVVYLYPNRGQLGGLLGGCTATAEGYRSETSRASVWAYLLELLVLIFAARILSWFRRA